VTDRLAEIEERWRKATDDVEEPWFDAYPLGGFRKTPADVRGDGVSRGTLVAANVRPICAEAIAAAPEDIAWLVAEVKRLRGER
jgi:hypothetical protein